MTERMGDTVRRELIDGLSSSIGVAGDVIDRPGTTVIAEESRAGTGQAACYQLGRHVVVPCDPAVLDTVSDLADGSAALPDAAFRAWVAEHDGSMLGQAVMKTQWSSVPPLDRSTDRLHVFDWDRSDDLALIQELIDLSSEDDLDEAEVAMDELDDLAVGLIDDDGRLVAYASARPFDRAPAFGDIGVIVRAGRRGGGRGRAVVAGLIAELLVPRSVLPLYRCDPIGNIGSDRLSAALGFEPALSLSVAELTA